jgi:RNA polymerase sigma factor, sigma-70 family
MKNQKITPETTYKTLKTMVPDASTVHTPKGETLIKSDSEILIMVKQDSATVIVYKNGFFAYIDDRGKVTAHAVANCHVMRYGKAEGGCNEVEETVFENMPFPIVLSQFGMMNIEHQEAVQVSRNENLSLDAENLPNDPRLTVPNFADELDLDGEGDIWEKRLTMLPEALECLTDRQRQIITLHYFKKMTHEQIAKSIGTSRPFVSKEVKKSLLKMEKYFSKNF